MSLEPAAGGQTAARVLAGYAAGLGAMALAASGNADASWLAAAALAHAQAGRQGERGDGGFTPMQVAQNLAYLC